MIDRDTVIDLCAAIDTAFMKQEVGTYNEFDKYATFALHIEAIVRAEEREACAEVAEQIEREIFDAVGDPRVSEFKSKIAAAIRARGQR